MEGAALGLYCAACEDLVFRSQPNLFSPEHPVATSYLRTGHDLQAMVLVDASFPQGLFKEFLTISTQKLSSQEINN